MTASAPRSPHTRNGKWFGSVVIVLTCAVTSAWAGLAPLAGAIVARGQFVVVGEHQKVQHRDGGRIAALKATEGQLVEASQTLVTFDTREFEIKRAQLNETMASQEKKLRLLRDEYDGINKLYARQLVTKQRYLALKRELIQTEADREDNQFKLKDVELQIANAELRSPKKGRVVKLAFHTLGGVVRPGDTILELVPADAKLQIDARIEPSQLDDVAVGFPVEIRLSGLNQKTTPTLRGVLSHISADALTDERSGASYFQVRIDVDDLDANTERFKLVAGMPAEAMIETGKRTVLEYATKPLTDIIKRSMREP